MNEDYWPDFWRAHGEASSAADPQTQVLRTFAKQPIDEACWAKTLAWVRSELHLTEGHRLVDLCCGNGLFSRDFAGACAHLTAVDVSGDLLAGLNALALPSVVTKESDMRALDFPSDSFDRILLYAAVQYLSERECVALFEQMFDWIEPGGILYVGDVPDRSRMWNFFDNTERQQTYFGNVKKGEMIVGTWFDPEWLGNLCRAIGFSSVRIVPQPDFMIYKSFRYELVAVR